jgi:hypothetical protein
MTTSLFLASSFLFILMLLDVWMPDPSWKKFTCLGLGSVIFASLSSWHYVSVMWVIPSFFLWVSERSIDRRVRLLAPLTLLSLAALILAPSFQSLSLPDEASFIERLQIWGSSQFPESQLFSEKGIQKIARHTFGFLLCFSAPNRYIRLLLSEAGNENLITGESDPKAGRYIGALERTLVYILIAGGQFSAAGLVFTAKGIARHKALEEKKFAEYFLLGSLSSFLWATIVALAMTA